jgi:hypothetical protein
VGPSEATGDLILVVTFSRASRLFICMETIRAVCGFECPNQAPLAELALTSPRIAYA